MKLTPGKLAGLQRVSDRRGVIAAAAMDQRGSLPLRSVGQRMRACCSRMRRRGTTKPVPGACLICWITGQRAA
jgi:hypothetical protein